MIDFKYSSILGSEDKKLYNIIHKEFIESFSIDNKNDKTITYHIVLANDDLDIEEYLYDKMKKEGITSFEISRIVSNKEQ